MSEQKMKLMIEEALQQIEELRLKDEVKKKAQQEGVTVSITS